MKKLIITNLLFLFLTNLFAQNSCCFLGNNCTVGDSAATFGVALGDLDGDNDLDAVTIAAYSHIEVWFNNGNSYFSGPDIYANNSSFYDVALNDLDEDGDLDIIAIPFTSDILMTLKNNGAGIFTIWQNINSGVSSYRSHLADLNGDGRDDLFLTNTNTTQKIYLNNGNGFNTTPITFVASNASDVALADYDNDGDIDAMLSDRYFSENQLWLNDGNANFSYSATYAMDEYYSGVAAGDLDNDGDTDFILYGMDIPREIWLNDGTGHFTLGVLMPNNLDYDKSVKLADYDNDGLLDLIIGIYGGLKVFKNLGNLNFSLCYSTGGSSHDIDVGDLNGDGLLDIYYGNFSNDDFDIVYLQYPSNITVDPDTAYICLGDSITLTASGANTYVWSEGLGTNNSVVVSPTTTTTYTVTGVSGSCSPVATALVIVNPLPEINVTTDEAEVCSGDTAILSVTGANSYIWSTSDTTSTIIVTPDTLTTYTVTGIDTLGCTNVGYITINTKPLPEIEITSTLTSICEGDGTLLSASGGISYIWGDGTTDANNVVYPDSTTSYVVTGYGSNGCFNTDTMTINVHANPDITFTMEPPYYCKGDTVELTATGGQYYHWNTGQDGNMILIYPDSATVYSVTVTNQWNCSNTAEINVEVYDKPNVEILTNKTDICIGEYVALIAEGAEEYSWNTGETFSEITVRPQSTMTYVVTGTNAPGCKDTANVEIKVQLCDIKIPNVITPNGDGVNDRFLIENLEILSLAKLQIYNRWGRLVYESEQYKNDWDANSVSGGTYFYTLEIQYINGIIKNYSGTITVIN
jgi:gliding motility-associated-like protein